MSAGKFLWDVLFLLSIAGVTLGAGLVGFQYGYDKGLDGSEAVAYATFVDRCMVQDAPPMCAEMLRTLAGHDSYTNSTTAPAEASP